ncbi:MULTISPECIES: hypothetical protein [Halorubrum]|nr:MULTISPECIES: hypothetical protein [Halorubrum]
MFTDSPTAAIYKRAAGALAVFTAVVAVIYKRATGGSGVLSIRARLVIYK